MNEFNNDHLPTPEFRESLEREIARAWRTEAFAEEPRRAWRPATIVGIAAGAVIMLTAGMMLGVSTGYASAEVILKERGETNIPSRPALAVLRNIPPLLFSCGNPPAVAVLPPPPLEKFQQQGVPIVDLPAAAARSNITLGGVLGLRQMSNGSLLVDDGARRQVRLFDSTLSTQTVVRDSVAGTPASYGPRPVPLIRYLGDSVLLADNSAGSFIVLGPTGQVSRVMAPGTQDMLLAMNLDFGGIDARGRVLYNARIREEMMRGLPDAYKPESAVVIRYDMEARSADTLARLRTWPSLMMTRRPGEPMRISLDPAPMIDEWASLSDGSIAVVRGRDYHIDWILPDGSTRSTGKLPFDWKRMTDEEKQKLIDSTGAALTTQISNAPRRAAPPGEGRVGRGGDGVATVQGPIKVDYVPPALKDIPDYYPSIRQHALMPDLDGNLWILPTSSAQSKNGELVYDVVNARGDFHRVRVPVGRSIVGFGKGGVVYMIAGDKTSGFFLERTALPKK